MPLLSDTHVHQSPRLLVASMRGVPGTGAAGTNGRNMRRLSPSGQVGRYVRGGRVGAVGALNTGTKPFFVVPPGERISVTEITFMYKGPARKLMGGFGWKVATGILTPFNSGAPLLKSPHRGWGFSPIMDMPAAADWTARQVTFPLGHWAAFAPAVGTNTRRDGSTTSLGDGRKFDTWIWIIDATNVSFLDPFINDQSPEFLVNDTDSEVVQVKAAGAVTGAAASGVEVRYAHG